MTAAHDRAHDRPYRTPAAFRRAVTERLRTMASADGRWALADLQRQFAYDRLLARLYLLDDGWVLKGSVALLARRIAVRHTIDVDVYREANRRQAERDLRRALTLDGGDWFTFDAGPGRVIAAGADGVRMPINARIGATTWARFHIDVVADGVRMTGEADEVPALTPLTIPGLPQPWYRAYPLLDHVADKTCAILERHGRARWPSARFKDLVDLVALVAHVSPSADAQRAALLSEADRRGLLLPRRFDVPDVALWQPGYEAEAGRALLPAARTLSAALSLVGPFLDPLLDGTASGTWNPQSHRWRN